MPQPSWSSWCWPPPSGGASPQKAHARPKNCERSAAPDPLDGINGTPTVANPYHYANNDPTNQQDPLGLRVREDEIRARWRQHDTDPGLLNGLLDLGINQTALDIAGYGYGLLANTNPADFIPFIDCKRAFEDGTTKSEIGWCAVDIATTGTIIKLAHNLRIGERLGEWLRHTDNIPNTNHGTPPLSSAPDAPSGVVACSFSGETEVVMADGSTMPIQEIKVGEQVLAVEPETGRRGARRVLDRFVHNDTLVNLAIDSGIVTTTEDHPVWNETDRAFQRADALDAGDLVLTADGGGVAVDGLVAGTEHAGTAYNLHIEEIHTYFVVVGDREVLVHNSCGGLTPGGGFDGTPGSSPALTNNPWHPDAVAARSEANQQLYGAADDILPDPTVADMLRRQPGSVTRAPLPAGSPSWDEIRDLPMSVIRHRARQGLPGYQTIKKLLEQERFGSG